MRSPVRILVILAALGVTVNCAFLRTDLATANAQFRQKKYDEALETYRKALARSHTAGQDATARYSIALILVSSDNPHKNYPHALEAFEEFLKLYPNHEKAPEALNWKGVLKTLVEERRECEQLKKNIEQLERLDIRHEEKRKGKGK